MGQSPLVWHWSLIQGPQPDICKSTVTVTESVRHIVTCLLPSFHQYQFILLGDGGTWTWTTCPELLPDSDPAGNRTHDHLSSSPMAYHYTTKLPIIYTHTTIITTMATTDFCSPADISRAKPGPQKWAWGSCCIMNYNTPDAFAVTQ